MLIPAPAAHPFIAVVDVAPVDNDHIPVPFVIELPTNNCPPIFIVPAISEIFVLLIVSVPLTYNLSSVVNEFAAERYKLVSAPIVTVPSTTRLSVPGSDDPPTCNPNKAYASPPI